MDDWSWRQTITTSVISVCLTVFLCFTAVTMRGCNETLTRQRAETIQKAVDRAGDSGVIILEHPGR